jgi:hypothetical protein
MKIAIHQPQYLPWLGYLDKVDSADAFILLDTVQYKKHEWQNRNRIRTKDREGWQWLTVPIIDRFPERIDLVGLNPTADWRRKHSQALRFSYAKAPHWEPLGPELLALLERPWGRLAELNVAALDLLCRHLGIATPRLLASSLSAREEPTDRLIDLCRAAGGTTYLAGQGGPEYMELGRFRDAGIPVEVQGYRHPVYPQRYEPFVSHLSVVDLLFNCGPTSLEILRSGRCWAPVG